MSSKKIAQKQERELSTLNEVTLDRRCLPFIERLKQGGLEFEDSQGFIGRTCLKTATGMESLTEAFPKAAQGEKSQFCGVYAWSHGHMCSDFGPSNTTCDISLSNKSISDIFTNPTYHPRSLKN